MRHVIHVPRRFVAEKWGGTETVIVGTTKRLPDFGYSSEIITPGIFADPASVNNFRQARSAKPVMDSYEGIPITRFNYFYPFFGLSSQNIEDMDNKGGNLFSWSLMAYLYSLKKKSVDLFHIHTMKRLGGIVRKAAAFHRVPYVISLHGGYIDIPQEERGQLTAPIRNRLEWGRLLGFFVGSRRVLQDAAAIICVGYSEYEILSKRMPHKKVVYQPNGVDYAGFQKGDPDRFRALYRVPKDRRIILNISRIDGQKNQILLLQSFAKLIPDFPDIHLVLIGPTTSTTYIDKLRADIEKRGLADRVTINRKGAESGAKAGGTDIVDAYTAAEVFVLPSRHEPFGIVILESWSTGGAVVASKVGGIVRFTEDNKDALLFDSGDVDGCAAQIGRILSDSALRDRLGRNGRQKAMERYDWRIITSDLANLYDEAIENFSRRD